MTHPRRLFRDVRTVAVGATSTVLLGPNPRRYAILLGTPPGSAGGGSSVGAASVFGSVVSMATLGVKLSYTATGPAVATYWNSQAYGSASAHLDLQLVRGATTYTIYTVTGPSDRLLNIPLSAGDTIQINCSQVDGAETCDLVLGIATQSAGGAAGAYVCFDFGRPATLNSFPLDPGVAPFFLSGDHVGDAIREEITAISSSGTVYITVMDIMEDCDCVPGKVGLAYPMYGNTGG